MYIQHNLPAADAARQIKINSSNYQKVSKKLSSGYKINSAADGAAELGISEQMRSQIRGLNQSVENAEDGANYIQVADGSMHEIHAMLQRMRELSVQSLNDTNTPADRAAMAAEFDQLQCEIDRISGGTDYNTQPVFGEHDPSYYQIAGNRKWEPDQTHFVEAPNNTLEIHLPDTYTPSDYSITIAPDVYTTQELMDEIDDALAAIKPSNPGFVFELSKDGYCNLNFEGGKNSPAKIDSVDGGLAYLIYDCYNSYSSSSLLGTTAFQGSWPLPITTGQNDELQFYIEKTDGTSEFVSMVIPGGKYSRSQLIDLINQNLAAYPDVSAKEYGGQCIQITGGATASITGLKGNMFKYEDSSIGEHVYTSIFYDNTRYGTASGEPFHVDGKAYYNQNTKPTITIDQNSHTLGIKMKGDADFTDISLLPAGSTSKDYTLAELAKLLNNAFEKLPGMDIEVSVQSKYISGDQNYVSGYYSYLQFTSKITGEDVSFEFDTTDAVSKEAYNALLRDTRYEYFDEARYSGSAAGIAGKAPLNGAITIPSNANTLSLSVNNTPVTITIPPKTYPSLSDLVAELNKQIPADQQGNIEFTSSGSYLQVIAKGQTSSVTFENTQGAYHQLFVGQAPNYVNEYATGWETYPQGSTAPSDMKMASITMPYDIPSDSTTIDSSNNRFSFSLNGVLKTVTLSDGTYTRSELIAELNSQLKAHNPPIAAEATLDGNRLTLATTLTGKTQQLSINAYSNYGSAWTAFVGTHDDPPDISTASPTQLQGVNKFTEITLDDSNRTFDLELSDGKKYTIEVPAKKYTDTELVSALQKAIDDKIGAGKISVSKNSSGILFKADQFSPSFYNPLASQPYSDFYKTVFNVEHVSKVTDDPTETDGTHTFSDAFIIGREDILNKQIEIAAGANNIFKLDFTRPDPKDPTKKITDTLEVTLDDGVKSSDDLVKELKHKLNAALALKGIFSFNIDVSIGQPHSTGVVGSNDDKALQITLTEAKDPVTGKPVQPAPDGEYVIDGIRGNAAYALFYKTTGLPKPSYTTGVQDISGGVSFPPGKNVLTMCVDSQEYSFTFDERDYTAEEFLKELNDKFQNGDDNNNQAPLEATLVDGHLRLTHKVPGSHTITEIGGTAKGIVFYHEEGRDGLPAYMLQVGSLGHQGLELPRLRVNTTALGINSLTITKPKYANKALGRLDEAITLLSTRRSLYGALHNRIEHITANNSNTSENLQASESRIRDTDFGTEMIKFACTQILQQSAQSMLAQANQLPNRVTELFR